MLCSRQQVHASTSQRVAGAAFRQARPSRVAARSSTQCDAETTSRRELLSKGLALVSVAVVAASCSSPSPALAASLPVEKVKVLCDDECVASLESLELVTLPSGLQYRDIVVGTGMQPPVGFQVVVNYVAMTPNGRVFDSSVEKGKPYDIRVGAGQVVAGLDEGLKTMRVGGTRRLYVPGNLSFPKGLKAAAGRPSVPPSSPVMFDVQLLYIPGLEDE